MDLYKEIENSFPLIEKLLSQDELFEFKNVPVSELYLYHLGLGIKIRNDFLYKKENPLYDLFLENGIAHTDEMSSLIIRLFHCYIGGVH